MKPTTPSSHTWTSVLLAGFASAALVIGGDGAVRAKVEPPDTFIGSGGNDYRLPTTSTGFRIGGQIPQPLVPGRTVRVNLRLANPTRVDLAVTRLEIEVAALGLDGQATTCSLDNFAVKATQLTPPLTLPARSGGTLRELGLKGWRWPRIGLLNLPVNQDECQGVTLSLEYHGRARQARP